MLSYLMAESCLKPNLSPMRFEISDVNTPCINFMFDARQKSLLQFTKIKQNKIQLKKWKKKFRKTNLASNICDPIFNPLNLSSTDKLCRYKYSDTPYESNTLNRFVSTASTSYIFFTFGLWHWIQLFHYKIDKFK